MPPTSFNLKQRLAALSLAQSAPSSPQSPHFAHTRNGQGPEYSYSPASPTLKRKIFNPTNWMKRQQSSPGEGQYCDGEEEKKIVQEVLSRMIFQAGVDFESVKLLTSFYGVHVAETFLLSGQGLCRRNLDSTRTKAHCSHFRVVLNASALPDPQAVSYDLLLTYV